MVLLKMLMEIALPKMGELLVMMMTMISPSGREPSPMESLCRRAKVLLPKFRLETAAHRVENPLLIFSIMDGPKNVMQLHLRPAQDEKPNFCHDFLS